MCMLHVCACVSLIPFVLSPHCVCSNITSRVHYELVGPGFRRLWLVSGLSLGSNRFRGVGIGAQGSGAGLGSRITGCSFHGIAVH